MAIPAHAARKAAGLGLKNEQNQHKSNCLLFKIKQQDYHIGDDDWEVQQSMIGKESKNDTKRRSSSATQFTDTDTSEGQKLLNLSNTIEGLLQPGHDNPLPLARLNFFAIFQSCVKVVSHLSNETHVGKEEQGINCICFASAILGGADRIVDGRRMGKPEAWRKDERECIQLAKDILEKAFGDVKAEEWQWKF
jgi:hypothetical protein